LIAIRKAIEEEERRELHQRRRPRAKAGPAEEQLSLLSLVLSLDFFYFSLLSFISKPFVHHHLLLSATLLLTGSVKVLDQEARVGLGEHSPKVVALAGRDPTFLLDEIGQREDAAARVLALVVSGAPGLVDDLALGNHDVEGHDVVLKWFGEVVGWLVGFGG
jgi:hypothetical protein